MAASNELLELALEELRRYYDKIATDYDRARAKILTLLGGTVIFLSFLYSSGDLFIPLETYGKIFYILGLAFLIIAVGSLFWASRPSLWALPAELKEIGNLESRYKDRGEFLEYLRIEYLDAIKFCKNQLSKKVQLLDLGGTMLFAGAIILLVIKYF